MAKLIKGEKFPNFVINTVYENNIHITDIVNHRPTMFMVLRYIGCTVCRYDVHNLIMRYKEFEEKGVNVAVVMQSNPKTVQRDLNGEKLPFYLICDEKQEIYKTLDILPAENMRQLVGNERDKLMEKGEKAKQAGFVHGDYEGVEEQLPAFFYIDSDLTVIKSHYAKNIVDMPSIDDMLNMI